MNIGYRSIKMEERTSEWRKGSFHRYTHPWARRGVKLSLHKDQWKQPPQASHTKQKTKEKDIEQELQRIKQKYRQTIQKTKTGFS